MGTEYNVSLCELDDLDLVQHSHMHTMGLGNKEDLDLIGHEALLETFEAGLPLDHAQPAANVWEAAAEQTDGAEAAAGSSFHCDDAIAAAAALGHNPMDLSPSGWPLDDVFPIDIDVAHLANTSNHTQGYGAAGLGHQHARAFSDHQQQLQPFCVYPPASQPNQQHPYPTQQQEQQLQLPPPLHQNPYSSFGAYAYAGAADEPSRSKKFALTAASSPMTGMLPAVTQPLGQRYKHSAASASSPRRMQLRKTQPRKPAAAKAKRGPGTKATAASIVKLSTRPLLSVVPCNASLKTPKHEVSPLATGAKCLSATPIPDQEKCSKARTNKKSAKRVRRAVGAANADKARLTWKIEDVRSLVDRVLANPAAADGEELALAQGLSLNPRDFKDIVRALGARIEEVATAPAKARVKLVLAPSFDPVCKPIAKPLLRIGQDKTYVMTSDISLKDRRRYDVFSDLQMGAETAFWCDQGNAHSVLDVSKSVQTLGSDGRHVNPRTIQVAHALASRVSRLLDTEVCVMKCFYYALTTRGAPKKRRKSEAAASPSSAPATPTSASRPLGLHKHIYMLCEQSIDDRHKCLPGSRVWLVRYFVKGQLDPALAPFVDESFGDDVVAAAAASARSIKRSQSSDLTLPLCS